MIRPIPTRLLALALLATPSAGGAQAASDVCPLAVRISDARPAGACLRLRTLPLPPEPAAPGRGRAELLPVRLSVGLRTAYPVDRNNGALWTGRGLSTLATFGAALRLGPLGVVVEPELAWSENRRLALPDTLAPGLSPFAYLWGSGRLDWYQRPGGGGRLAPGLGASHAELALGPVRGGLSNERLWWGPARRYPLLFSGTAPGFPHVFAETARSLSTPLGGFGASVLWGRLEESRWYDEDPRNDFSLLGAFQLRWRVDFVPGLDLAYAVARHDPLPDRSLRAARPLQLFTGDPAGSPPHLRGMPMGTVSARLALPDAGVEAYAEVGRGEGFLNPLPGVSDSRLSLIYVLGFARTDTTAAGQRWRVSGEVMKQAMELPQPRAAAASADEYAAPMIRQGHTHRGQLLGAYVGPGSNAQYLAFDWLGEARRWGLFAERARRDDDTYFRRFASDYGFRGHDLEWTLGVRAGGWLDAPFVERVVGPIAVGIEAGVSRRKNRAFTGLGDENWALLREWNGWADLYLVWDPRLR